MVTVDLVVLTGILVYLRATFSWESLQKTDEEAEQMFTNMRDEIRVRQSNAYIDNSESQQSLLRSQNFEDTLRQPSDERRMPNPELSISAIPSHGVSQHLTMTQPRHL